MKKTIFAVALAAVALATTSCGGEQGLVTMGNSSELDSLSYSLGANIGFSVGQQMGDIPFDYNSIAEGLEAAAMDKSELAHDDAVASLRDYFMTKRQDRAAQVEVNRNIADSIALTEGKDPADIAEARANLKADAAMFESEAERAEISYAFGIDLGTNLKSAEIPIQIYWINTAMAAVNAGTSLIDAQEARAYLTNYFEVVRPAELMAEIAEKMADIAKQKGVVTTESGLMYRVEKAGDLQATDDRDVVKVLYTGRLVRNNEMFDTNRFADQTPEAQAEILEMNPDAATADEPVEFPLNRVIPGWTEGMKLVGKGGRISLWIPTELAYGERGAGRSVGPNEALYFDVELVDVQPYVEAEEETEAEVVE